MNPDPSDAGQNAQLTQLLVDAFLENIPDLIYFKDLESRFITTSRSFWTRIGASSVADLIGKTDHDLFTTEHANDALKDEQAIIRTGTPILGKLEKESWSDGRVTWSLTSKLPLRNEAGVIIGTFGISKDVTESKHLEDSLDHARKELLNATRAAGMAEVATGVLHNVGNVLNSVNVSATLIFDGLRAIRISSLGKVCALIAQHRDDLGSFIADSPQGRQLPAFLDSLHAHLTAEQTRLLTEIDALRSNIDHIKDIVTMQQNYASVTSTAEPLVAETLVLESLRMNAASITRHDVQVIRDFQPVPLIFADKPKMLQILVNLMRNAKHALSDSGRSDKQLTLRIVPGTNGTTVRISVIDNGVGIPAENITRIFSHGFTTRKNGHGFGLHSSALVAKEMGATLVAHSDGPGLGATFILEVPVATTPVEPPPAQKISISTSGFL